MEWTDEAIIIGHRAHGETSAIAEVFTRGHGRYSGLVRGGRSRQMRPVLQVGNHVEARWTARLSDHLGSFRAELLRGYAAEAMTDPARLAGLSSVCSFLRLLPERDPHANLFEITLFLLGFLNEDEIWPALMVRWEMALLEELGFGLDLSACAATGQNDNLIYVSPRSGRAVSASAGADYADRLLKLPDFLVSGRDAICRPADVVNGFALTGHFLEKHVYAPKGEKFPETRGRMVALVAKRDQVERD